MKPLSTETIGLELRTRVADAALAYTNAYVNSLALARRFRQAYMNNDLPALELTMLHQRALDTERESKLAQIRHTELCIELAEQFTGE